MADTTICNVAEPGQPAVHFSHDARKWRAFRSRERCPDGKYRPNTLPILDRLAAEAFRIEVPTVAAM